MTSYMSKSTGGTGAATMYKQQYSEGYMVSRPKVKKKKSYDSVFPSGFDDGKGAQRLLKHYIEETLAAKQKKQHVLIPFETITDDFKNSTFLEQVNHLEMNNIPLLSQVAKQRALLPHHSTDKKKRLIDIARRLKRNDSTLVRIRLNNESIDDTVLAQIVLALPKNTYLQHMMLHFNAITDDGLNTLCLALRWHPTFHCLWIGANKITDIGAKHMANLLHRNPRIKELNISNKWPSKIWARNQYDLHPHITYIGGEHISKQLLRGCGLTSLSLADQRLRDDGAIALFQTLIYCELRSLNLSGNELTDRCCGALGTVLGQNPILEILTLSHNTICDGGATLVAGGLGRNHLLHALDLSHNTIGNAGLAALHACLETNTVIGTIVTLNNRGSDDRAEVAAAARKHGIFAFGALAVGAAPSSSDLHHSTSTSSLDQKRLEGIISPTRRQQAHNLHHKHYHGGDQFISSDEADILATSCTAVAANIAAVYEQQQKHQPLVKPSPANGLTEFGDVVHINGDSSVDKASSRTSPALRPTRLASVSTPEQQLERLSSPWRVNTYEPHHEISSRGSSPAASGQVVVPGVGILGKSSLSSSYRNLFAAPSDGGPGSRPASHEGKRNVPPVASPAALLVSESSSPAKKAQPSLSGGIASLEATGNVLDNSAVDLASLRRKPSFIRTLSNLSANSASSVTSEQLIGESLLGRQGMNTAGTDGSGGSNDNATNREKRKAAATRSSFYGAMPSRDATPNFPRDKEPPLGLGHNTSVGTMKPSRTLGRTVGIPTIKNIGVMPVRTSISSDRDSAQHFIYLRIATAGDGVADRPTSLLQIAKDRETEIAKLKKYRQSAQYKMNKQFALTQVNKVTVQKAAEPKVPDEFWADWKKKVRLQYLKGIDKARNCTSTRLEPIPVAPVSTPKTRAASKRASTMATQAITAAATAAAAIASSGPPLLASGAVERDGTPKASRRVSLAPLSATQQQQQAQIVSKLSPYDLAAYQVVNYKTNPELAYQRHLGANRAKARPGQILAARRKENLIRRERERQQQLKDDTAPDDEAVDPDRVKKHIHFTSVVAGLKEI